MRIATWFFAWHLTSQTDRIKQYHEDIKTLFYTTFLWEAELYLAFRRLKVDVQAWNLTSTTLLSSARFTVGWNQLREIDLQDKPQVSKILLPFRWMPQPHTGIVILTDLITIICQKVAGLGNIESEFCTSFNSHCIGACTNKEHLSRRLPHIPKWKTENKTYDPWLLF